MEPQFRFCTSADGVRIAYLTYGTGPPLLYVSAFWTGMGEALMNPADIPQIIVDAVDGDVWPSRKKTAMMIMVFREIVSEHFAIQPINRMQVSAAIAVRRSDRVG